MDLRTLGHASTIDARALPAGWPDGLGGGVKPDATGSLRSSGWMWSRAAGPIDTVVVLLGGLVPPVGSHAVPPVRHSR